MSIPKTKWPDATPAEDESMIVSISCGNSHLHWASHFGADTEFAPKIFWRTPHLTDDDMDIDPLSVLSRNLPDDPHDFIFGEKEIASPENAQKQAESREVSKLSVYVVSSNSAQISKLAKIWKTVPSRVYVMKGDDFFKKSEGRYDTMGTDRLATLCGATYLYGAPALVFDGGTATTYSASDCAGNILGGGIGPGLQSKFRSLAQDTADLPHITPDEVMARVSEALDTGKPLRTFAADTHEAIMVDAFQEFALKGRNVIEHWLDKANNNSTLPKVGRKINTDRRVLCTGGDGDILQHLLQPYCGGIIEQLGTVSKTSYEVEVSKHLIHYGIAAALVTQVKLRENTAKYGKKKHESYIGERVAKMIGADGDIVYRGEVSEIVETDGEKEFRIVYDDGESEDVSLGDLYELMKLFSVYGEKKQTPGRKSKVVKDKTPAKDKKDKDKADKKVAREKRTPAKSAEKDKPAKEKKTPGKTGTRKSNGDADAADNKPSTPATSGPGRKRASAQDAKSPAPKKAKKDQVASLVNESKPESFVRQRIAKDFDGETYFGTIMEYDDSEDPAFWHVEYDDGDAEDYSKKDLIKAIKHYEKHGKDDPSK